MVVLNTFSILEICLHPDFGKNLSLEFCRFLSKRVHGQAFEGRSWEDLFDLALGWVIASDLTDATKKSSNNRWMEVFWDIGSLSFLEPNICHIYFRTDR